MQQHNFLNELYYKRNQDKINSLTYLLTLTFLFIYHTSSSSSSIVIIIITMSFSPSHHHQQLNHRCHLHTSTRKFSREPQAPSPSQSQHPMLPQLLSYAAVLERSAAAHVYAQQLNNVASLCLEVGQYDKAISSLGKALRLSELHIVDQLLDRAQACTCHDCSLDGCITYSETSASNVNHANLQNKMMVVEDCDPEEEGGGGSAQTTTSTTSHMSSSSIYRRPIRIPPRSIAGGHNMGSTLFLIVTFNLALAHHLKAVSLLASASTSSTSTNAAVSSSSVASSTLIANTLQLYELTNNWQHRLGCTEEQEEEEDDHEDDYDDDCDSDSDSDDDSIMTMDTTDEEEEEETPSRTTTASPMNKMKTTTTYCSSVRFNMILCTNLSHLHRLMKNDTLSTQCLEQLLSTVMLVIDQNKNHHREQQPPQPHPHPHVTIDGDNDDVDAEFEYCDDDDEDDADDLLLPSSSSRSRFIDVQGFVPNTTSLILYDQCADAA